MSGKEYSNEQFEKNLSRFYSTLNKLFESGGDISKETVDELRGKWAITHVHIDLISLFTEHGFSYIQASRSWAKKKPGSLVIPEIKPKFQTPTVIVNPDAVNSHFYDGKVLPKKNADGDINNSSENR